MQYVQVGCVVCVQGVLGIRRCSDGKTLIVMCDECETVWSNPQQLGADSALDATPPEWIVRELGVAIAGDKAGWATNAEVAAAGWADAVRGTQN